MIEVRHELPADFDAVYRINELAFGRTAEAELVNRLRNSEPYISLVAVENDLVVGHIFFSRVTFSPENGAFNALGLAPMAVLPEKQRDGIGSKLARAGLEECQKRGVGIVVVLGHRHYYPRFGFQPANNFGLTCEYDVPVEAFMAIELKENALNGVAGVIRYGEAFKEL